MSRFQICSFILRPSTFIFPIYTVFLAENLLVNEQRQNWNLREALKLGNDEKSERRRKMKPASVSCFLGESRPFYNILQKNTGLNTPEMDIKVIFAARSLSQSTNLHQVFFAVNN